ncbi:MAG TPA: ABC transporter substrate-binding protein, partial [Chloroflexota bacterium]
YYLRMSTQRPALIALIALTLAACGGAAAPASSPPESSAAAKPASSAAAKPAGSVAAAPASAKPAAMSALPVSAASLQDVIDGAKKESSIKGSWSSDSFGGPEGWNAMVAGVNKKWGLNVKGTFTPGIDMQSMQGKIAQEAAANQPSDSDVYLGNSQAMRDALDTNTMKPYDWKSLLPQPLQPDTAAKFDPYAPNGTGVAIASAITGVTYNSKLVKADLVPHKLNDLLNPALKGKIASTPYAAGFRDFATKDMLGKQAMIDFVTKFSPQVAGLIRCGSDDQIVSGEFWMLALDCGASTVEHEKAQGQPVDQVVLDDITSVHSFYAAVPRNSQAPNTAALIAVWLTTPEGQSMLYNQWGSDLYTYSGAHSKAQIDKVRAAAGKFAVDSPQWISENPDFPQTQQELQNILAKKK